MTSHKKKSKISHQRRLILQKINPKRRVILIKKRLMISLIRRQIHYKTINSRMMIIRNKVPPMLWISLSKRMMPSHNPNILPINNQIRTQQTNSNNPVNNRTKNQQSNNRKIQISQSIKTKRSHKVLRTYLKTSNRSEISGIQDIPVLFYDKLC